MKKYVFFLVIIVVLSGCKKDAPTSRNDDGNEIQIQTQFPLTEYSTDLDFGVYRADLGRYHAAEDAYDEAGTPVYAMADGAISYSGYMYGYGYLIVINYADLNVYSLYGHLSTRRWKKESGRVEKGELIAYLGDEDENSGADYTLPPHLHFGIRRGYRQDYPGGTEDNRWMAGWTDAEPSTLGWLDPTDYILGLYDLTDIAEVLYEKRGG